MWIKIRKEDSNMNPHNQKSLNLYQHSRKTEIEIDSNYDSKLKSKAIGRKIKMAYNP